VSLRRKTFVIFVAALAILGVGLYFISRQVLLGSFANLEEQEMRYAVGQVFEYFSIEQKNLMATTKDYANWDDTYAFLQSRDETFIQSNLSGATLLDLHVNFVILFDQSFASVRALQFDSATREGEPQEAEEAIIRAVHSALLRRSKGAANNAFSGLLSVHNKTAMLAACPILTSKKKGPPRGIFVMGRWVDDDEVQRAGQAMRISLRGFPFASPPLNMDEEILNRLKGRESILILPVTPNEVSGFGVIRDVEDKPALLLMASRTPAIYIEGRTTFWSYLLLLAAIGVLFGVLGIGLLERLVLARLARLSEGLGRIARERDFSGRVEAEGSDELGQLGESINHTLQGLEEARLECEEVRTMRENDDRLRRQVPALAEFSLRTLRESGNLDDIIHQLTEMAARTIEVQRVGVWFFSDDHTRLVGRDLFDSGVKEHTHAPDLIVDSFPTYFKALESERALVASDAPNDPRTQEFSADYLIPLGIGALMDAPIRIGGRVVGVVCHEHIGPARKWTLAEQEFAGSVADLIALHIEDRDRKKAEEALRYRIQFERLITSISTRFISVPEEQLDAEIEQSLAKIGAFVQADRSYIFDILPGGESIGNTHEWCAEGIEPQKENLQDIPVKSIPWWMSQLRSGRIILIPRVPQMPAEASTEKAMLEAQGVHSLVAVPMITRGNLVGFLGFDAVRREKTWPDDVVALLKIVGEILTNALDAARADDALRESEARNRALLHALPDMMFLMSADGVFLDYHARNEEDLLMPAESFLGKNFREIFPESLAGIHALAQERALKTREMQVIEYPLRIRGKLAYFEARVVPCGQNRVLAIVRNVTDRKQAEERIVRHVFHDSLTDLPNRTLLMDRIGQCLERARGREKYQFAILLADMDRFKNVNDSLGHSAGDRLLMEIGHRLASLLRPGDTIARPGGDEFVILLDDIPGESAALRLADRIHEVLEQPFWIQERSLHVTASVGVAFGSPKEEQAEGLLRNAEIAMYRAKALGRGLSAIFDEAMHKQTIHQLELESGLRRALQGRELEMHYQPIMPLNGHNEIGLEALLRWRHPQLGLLTPGELIAIAEDTDLIVPLGTWVLRESCKQLRAWRQRLPANCPISIAINLSMRQFTDPLLVDKVQKALGEAATEPGMLWLELTESSLMKNPEYTTEVLGVLHRLGVRLVVDDFGSGYSSLSYLRQFSLDALKIDRSLILGIEQESKSMEIVRSVVSLGHNLGLRVIAEGVEEEAQLEKVRHLGCDFVQGFYFQKPAPAPEIELWINAQLQSHPKASHS